MKDKNIEEIINEFKNEPEESTKIETEKIISELENEFKFNQNQIQDCHEKENISEINKLEYKLMGIIGYTAIVQTILYTINLLLITLIPNIAKLLAFAMPIISLTAGTAYIEIENKKRKIKKRFESFSESKTELDKLKSEIKYAIEKEKYINRNEAIKKAIRVLKSSKIEIRNCNNIESLLPPENKYSKNVKKIENDLRKKINELDILSTQKILIKKFSRIRCEREKNSNIFISILFGKIFSVLLIAPITLFALNSTVQRLILVDIGMISSPILLTIINKKYKKTFNYFNDELKENSLSMKVKDDEINTINQKINMKIEEICTDIIHLQEERINMESYKNSNTREEKIQEAITYIQHENETNIKGKSLRLMPQQQAY